MYASRLHIPYTSLYSLIFSKIGWVTCDMGEVMRLLGVSNGERSRVMRLNSV